MGKKEQQKIAKTDYNVKTRKRLMRRS
jgi:hypothetical protein